jgi:hypothetical protein
VSNFLAVATVTAALQRLLQDAAGADVPGAKVTTDRPETRSDTGPNPLVNVYLFQVIPNGAERNNDLPTRSEAGVVMQRPRAALDLHYLISFYGSEDELEPQRLLGSVVRTLHASPVLTQQLIDDVQTAATAAVPKHPSLATTDLADQIDRVKLMPLSLNLEELSKLWSVFFQTPYALSVAYQASVVLLEQALPVTTAQRVLERSIAVVARREPVVTSVSTLGDPGDPTTASSSIDIAGSDLMGDVTLVRVAGADRAAVSTRPSHVIFDLSSVPPGSLRAGPQTVQIVQQIEFGSPPVPHSGASSNVATFLLHPTIATITPMGTGASGSIAVQFDLNLGKGQIAVLALLDAATGQRTYLVAASPHTTDGTSAAFPISGVPAGDHMVQVVVDGAETALQRNAAGTIVGPKVTLT